MKSVLNVVIMTAALLMALSVQSADQFPQRAVRMVVPFPVGGATDILARVVAQKASEYLGQVVVVDNRPGAGGTLGSRLVVTSTPDGYTILMGTTSTHAIGPHLYTKPPYDPIADFSPITQVASSPNVLMVAAQVPAKSLKELVALAKSQPGKLNFGSSGTGTQFHLSGELLKQLAGIDIVHVPYKGTALVYPEMYSGAIQILFDVPPVALPFLKQGRVRALGVSGQRRIAVLPDVPTIVEAGIAGYDADLWFGMFAPARVPPQRLARLQHDVLQTVHTVEVRERFTQMGADVIGSTPAVFATFLKADNDKWSRVVRVSGAKIE